MGCNFDWSECKFSCSVVWLECLLYRYRYNEFDIKIIKRLFSTKDKYMSPRQGCGSGSGSVLDPYSIGSVDPDPDP
jgi:hypothetical protein